MEQLTDVEGDEGSMEKRFIAMVVAIAALVLVPRGMAQAQETEDPRAAARELGREGVEACKSGDFPTAAAKLEQAYQLHKAPAVALWLGKALFGLGKWVEAAERFREATQLSVESGTVEVQAQAQQEAVEELARLEPRIPKLVIRLAAPATPDAVVTVDDVPIPATALEKEWPVNPGPHQVQATSGQRNVHQQVTAIEAEIQQVTLELPRAQGQEASVAARSAPARPPVVRQGGLGAAWSTIHRPAGWIALSVGGSGLALWAVSGVLALTQRDTLLEDCPNRQCPPGQRGALDDYRTYRAWSTVGFWVGATSATVGGALLLTAPKKVAGETRSGQLEVNVGLGRTTVQARF